MGFKYKTLYFLSFAFAIFFCSNLLLLGITRVNAQSPQLDLYFFYSPTCPHCHAEWDFLDTIENQYPQVSFHRIEVTDENQQALLLNFLMK